MRSPDRAIEGRVRDLAGCGDTVGKIGPSLA